MLNRLTDGGDCQPGRGGGFAKSRLLGSQNEAAQSLPFHGSPHRLRPLSVRITADPHYPERGGRLCVVDLDRVGTTLAVVAGRGVSEVSPRSAPRVAALWPTDLRAVAISS